MELQQVCDRAVALAEETGRRIVAVRRHEGLIVSHKRGVELLTSADLEADQLICGRLEAAFPADRILSEESSPQLEDGSWEGGLWIVDPIDGTVNYAYGQPQVAVSIARAVDGCLQVAVVHAPFLGETFVAVRGGGARLNGEPIRPSACTELHRALVGTGFCYERDRREALLPRLGCVLRRCRDIRRAGSAALDLCWVACGRLDAFYETLSPWDVAAGRLILAEAGGRVANLGVAAAGVPSELDGQDLVAAAPGVFAAFVELLTADR